MAEERDLRKKLDEFDAQVDFDSARKLYKAKLISRINKGEVGLLSELEQLKKLEARGTSLPDPSPPVPHDRPGEDEPEYGIPGRLRVNRRPYTLTPEALTQRRKAARSGKKSEAMKGNRNAWKTGEHARGFIRQLFRPCKSTCPQYPCAVVDDGGTAPGDACLDKVQFLRTLQAIETAMDDPKKLDDLKAVAALRIAGGMEVVDRLIRDILEDGTIVKSEKWDKEGALLGYELKNHPALPFLAKLMETLNLTPEDWMTTALVIRKTKTEEKKARTLGDIMSGIGRTLSDASGEEG